MTNGLSRTEIGVLAFFVFCAVLWPLMPAIAQPQSYHAFADQRAWLGIPNAADVLSNIGFAVAGVIGFWRMTQHPGAVQGVVRACLIVFFAGMLVTAWGSGYYHWSPGDATLVWDRFSMTIAFSGMLAALTAQRVSARAALTVLIVTLIVGPFSVFHWKYSGDLALYGIVQFGGLLGAILLLAFTKKGDDYFPWWTLILWYAVAKICESADVLIWNATNQIVAGHALKHLAAGMGGIAVANALAMALAQSGGSFRADRA